MRGLGYANTWKQTRAVAHCHAPGNHFEALAVELNRCRCKAAVSTSKLQQPRHTAAAAAAPWNGSLQQPAWGSEAPSSHQRITYQQALVATSRDFSESAAPTPLLDPTSGLQQQQSQLSFNEGSVPGSRCGSSVTGTSLWPVSAAGEVEVQVDDSSEDTSTQQQRYSSRRHHRHRSSHTGGLLQAHRQQQGIGVQQQWQPESHSADDVDLLQQVVMVRSWSAALRLLQRHPQLKQAHVGLLWSQLQPELQAREKAAISGTGAVTSSSTYKPHPHCSHTRKQRHWQRDVQRVLLSLCGLTQQLVKSMTPQSLAYTLEGLAAAIRAGDVVLVDQTGNQQQQQQQAGCSSTAISLNDDILKLLWCRLLAVAGGCTAEQLARCLSAGRQLGWYLTCSSSSSQADDPNSRAQAGCCWPILEAACTGQLVKGLPQHDQKRRKFLVPQHHISWSSNEAGKLLSALTALFLQAQAQQLCHNEGLQQQYQLPPGRTSWQQQHPLVYQLVCDLLKQASHHPAEAVRPHSLGQGVTYTYPPGTPDSSNTNSRSPGSTTEVISQQQAAAAASILQSAAVLGVAPCPGDLEQLVQTIEPCLGVLSVSHVFEVLKALTELQVEPWQSWMTACMSRIEAGLHLLTGSQLLQLLPLLPLVRTVQPSQRLLQNLARLTAKNCCRYSWAQLALLPLGFAGLQYTPPALWSKDYLAATSAAINQQRLEWDTQRAEASAHQSQPQQHHLEQLQLCAQMLTGVSYVNAPGPSVAWLSSVDSLVVLLIQQSQPGSIPLHYHPAGAAAASRILQAFQHFQYQPSQQLLDTLGACICVDVCCQQVVTSTSEDVGKQYDREVAQSSLEPGDPDTEPALCDSSSGSGTSRECTSSRFSQDMLCDHHLQDAAGSGEELDPIAPAPQHVNQALGSVIGTTLGRRLGEIASQHSGLELFPEGSWKQQRVCTSKNSKRLVGWGVLVQQGGYLGGALLATL